MATHAVTGGAVVYTYTILKEKQQGSTPSHSRGNERATSVAGPERKPQGFTSCLVLQCLSSTSKRGPCCRSLARKITRLITSVECLLNSLFLSTMNVKGLQLAGEDPVMSHVTNFPLHPMSCTPCLRTRKALRRAQSWEMTRYFSVLPCCLPLPTWALQLAASPALPQPAWSLHQLLHSGAWPGEVPFNRP